jgi:hypothetical protein
MSVLLGVIGAINFVQLHLVSKKCADIWRRFQADEVYIQTALEADDWRQRRLGEGYYLKPGMVAFSVA